VGDVEGDGSTDQLASILSGVTPSGYIPVIERSNVFIPGGSIGAVSQDFALNFNEDEKLMYFSSIRFTRNLGSSVLTPSAAVPLRDPGIKVIGSSDPVNLELQFQLTEGTLMYVYLSGRFEPRVAPIFAEAEFPTTDRIAINGNYWIACAVGISTGLNEGVLVEVPPRFRPVVDEILPFFDSAESSVPTFYVEQANGASAQNMLVGTNGIPFADGVNLRPNGPYGVIRSAPFEALDVVQFVFTGLEATSDFDLCAIGHFEST
jgi:hypothetical protein